MVLWYPGLSPVGIRVARLQSPDDGSIRDDVIFVNRNPEKLSVIIHLERPLPPGVSPMQIGIRIDGPYVEMMEVCKKHIEAKKAEAGLLTETSQSEVFRHALRLMFDSINSDGKPRNAKSREVIPIGATKK